MDILIIKLGAIGDILRTTSILPGLKGKYGGCRIKWVTKRDSFDILKNNSLINAIYLIEDNLKVRLKNENFDLIVNFDDDREACELASYLNSKKIIGAYLKNNKRAYTEDSALWFDMGLISKLGKKRADTLKASNKKTYQEILFKILGVDGKKYKAYGPVLNLNKRELEFGKKFVKKQNIKKKDLVIGINTGAGGRWHEKKLSIEKTVKLINKLSRQIKNAKILLFGGPEEKERNRQIKEKSKTRLIDAGCDNSLMEFASLVNLCNILVTSDSLAMHIGIALKKKIVAFFYPTSASEIEMYNRGIKIIGEGRDYCSYKPKCDYPPKWDIGKMVDSARLLAQAKQ